MSGILPIGAEELLTGAVEGARLEFKASWDPKTTGHQVLKTLCAYANDLQNLNGGYVVLGVAEVAGVAVRPARGLGEGVLDDIQKWIRGNCNRIEPTYMPVMDTPLVDGVRVLVVWCPASDSRPHQAPDGPKGARKGPRRIKLAEWPRRRRAGDADESEVVSGYYEISAAFPVRRIRRPGGELFLRGP